MDVGGGRISRAEYRVGRPADATRFSTGRAGIRASGRTLRPWYERRSSSGPASRWRSATSGSTRRGRARSGSGSWPAASATPTSTSATASGRGPGPFVIGHEGAGRRRGRRAGRRPGGDRPAVGRLVALSWYRAVRRAAGPAGPAGSGCARTPAPAATGWPTARPALHRADGREVCPYCGLGHDGRGDGRAGRRGDPDARRHADPRWPR